MSDPILPEEEGASCSSFFSRNQWILFCLVVLSGIAIRWIGLDERPIHHDESLYATWSKYYYEAPTTGFYRYDPMLHGPLMYHLVALAYHIFGVSEWSARFVPALFGSFMILLPFFFRRLFSAPVVLLLTTGIAFSPTLTYWSRFLREDTFVLIGVVCTLWGLFLARPSFKPLLFFIGVSLQIASKENCFVHAALVYGYLAYEFILFHFSLRWRQKGILIRFVVAHLVAIASVKMYEVLCFMAVYVTTATPGASPQSGSPSFGLSLAIPPTVLLVYYLLEFSKHRDESDTTLLATISRYVKHNRGATCLGLLAGIFVYVLLFTCGFQYSEGPLDGIYRKSIEYWWKHHSMERIAGPFLLSFYTMAWYESVLLLGIAGAFIYSLRKAPYRVQCISVFMWVLAFVVAWATYDQISKADGVSYVARAWKFFKLKDGLDIFGLIIIASHALILTTYYLNRSQRGLAITAYAFWALLFSYCYLGEKVPWLAMYPTIAGYLYLGVVCTKERLFQDGISKNTVSYRDIAAFLGALFMLLGVLFVLTDLSTSSPVIVSLRSSAGNNWGASFLGIIFLGIAGILSLPSLVKERIRLTPLLLGAGALMVLQQNFITNFGRAGDASEFLSQVHTTRDMRDTVKHIRLMLENKAYSVPYADKVLVNEEAIWPLTWYFRDLPSYNFIDDVAKAQPYRFMIKDAKDGQSPPEGYKKHVVRLRGWWVPDYPRMGLKQFLLYALTHRPWGVGEPTGYSSSDLFIYSPPLTNAQVPSRIQ
jgi:uncharacterized protein (TIGR03663 family)